MLTFPLDLTLNCCHGIIMVIQVMEKWQKGERMVAKRWQKCGKKVAEKWQSRVVTERWRKSGRNKKVVRLQ